MWPHRRQPIRLPCPWDSPGKNTGVGCHFFSPMRESEKWKGSRSVVSDSLRPHGPQPTRLLHPWDFPGKSTGVGCHCLLRPNSLPIHALIYSNCLSISDSLQSSVWQMILWVHSHCDKQPNFFPSLWLSNIPCTYYRILFIHSPVDRHLGCFQVLVTLNSSAVNTVHFFKEPPYSSPYR